MQRRVRASASRAGYAGSAGGAFAGWGPHRAAFIAVLVGGALALAACGDDAAGVRVVRGDGDDVDFGADARVVVTDEGTFVVSGNSDECIVVEKYCLDLDEETGRYCGEPGAQADVIVVDGEIVEVICFPPDDEGTPVEEVVIDDDGTPTIPQNQNGLVIIFDESTDGTVIEGNLVIDAERTTVYGNGVDETIIGGNITIASNNSRVRALTVQGNVHYEENSNNSAISFCRIHGNLHVDSNGFAGLGCEVYGNVEVSGNDATLVNIGVGGEWHVTGSNPVCDGCYSIDDEDGDFMIDEGEIGDPVDCN